MQMFVIFPILIAILFLLVVMICSHYEVSRIYGLSPSFGHQEIRDELFDLVDMKKCISVKDTTSAKRCGPTQEGNQSIDILSVDYFSNGKILNATFWLVSEIKNISLYYNDIPSYGAFVDADSNLETGWQGIDYQIENVWNNGIWNSTLYQFSSAGHTRVLHQDNITTEELYKKGQNHVLLYLDLTAIGSPENYKVMFYAEDRERNNLIWKTDFSSWIDVPKSDLTISSTPEKLELRPNDRQNIGIQLASNIGSPPEVSNFIIKELPANIKLNRVSHGNLGEGTGPVEFELQIPDSINIGKYAIPIIANITKNSTIPNLPIQHLNLGYSFEKMNLPVSVLRSFTWEEQIINFWQDWGSSIAFIVGIITGKVGTVIWDIYKKRIQKRQRFKEDKRH